MRAINLVYQSSTSYRSRQRNKYHGTSQTRRIEKLVRGFSGTPLSDITNKLVQILTLPATLLCQIPNLAYESRGGKDPRPIQPLNFPFNANALEILHTRSEE